MAICAQQTDKAVLSIGGCHHLADETSLGRKTLFDHLVQTKKVISLNLLWDNDEAFSHHWQKKKDALANTPFAQNHVGDFLVRLPPMNARQDTRFFTQWDRIALANGATDLVLSQQNRVKVKAGL